MRPLGHGTSIPRLELLGATILVRLAKTVQNALPQKLEAVYWVDSMTVLHWIRNKPWHQYVLSRVYFEEIREGTTPDSWKFCPGERNPADIPSRGMNARGSCRDPMVEGPWISLQPQTRRSSRPINNGTWQNCDIWTRGKSAWDDTCSNSYWRNIDGNQSFPNHQLPNLWQSWSSVTSNCLCLEIHHQGHWRDVYRKKRMQLEEK